jgi:hypothetical protein
MTIVEFISSGKDREINAGTSGLIPEVNSCVIASFAVPDDNFHFTERIKLKFARLGVDNAEQ